MRRSPFARRFRSEVVLAFQNPEAMLFHPSVFDEIAFAPRQRRRSEQEVRETVERWASVTGVTDLLERSPWELSAGEQQKVCLAAILAVGPRLLLLDEPTASLDPRSTGWLVDFLDELGLTTVIATHSLSLAPELGNRALVLGEDHRLLWDGPTEELLGDAKLLVRANLAHSHRHRHGGRTHRHFHIHDWS
ncbi:MAG: energy-coupling factor ABC transporter ATP-binding protein [Acidobacteriota bacterium]|nr:energy-coupling factor ABC transporter ATP-binding protein [Acidobacteriota bacterium]